MSEETVKPASACSLEVRSALEQKIATSAAERFSLGCLDALDFPGYAAAFGIEQQELLARTMSTILIKRRINGDLLEVRPVSAGKFVLLAEEVGRYGAIQKELDETEYPKAQESLLPRGNLDPQRVACRLAIIEFSRGDDIADVLAQGNDLLKLHENTMDSRRWVERYDKNRSYRQA